MQHAFRLDPEILVCPKQWPSLLGWSLNALAGAALVHRHRVEPELPPWTLVGLSTRGSLLGPPLRTREFDETAACRAPNLELPCGRHRGPFPYAR